MGYIYSSDREEDGVITMSGESSEEHHDTCQIGMTQRQGQPVKKGMPEGGLSSEGATPTNDGQPLSAASYQARSTMAGWRHASQCSG